MATVVPHEDVRSIEVLGLPTDVVGDLRSRVLKYRDEVVIRHAGHVRPTQHIKRIARLFAFDRPVVFDHVVTRVLVNGCGLTSRAGYRLTADLYAYMLGVHVDPDAIRKRLDRHRACPSRILCGSWQILLFDMLGLPPTELHGQGSALLLTGYRVSGKLPSQIA